MVDWIQYCRDVALEYFTNHHKQLGGPGSLVEIDESIFAQRKNNVGRVVPDQWVFGAYEPATKKGFLLPVPRRDAVTLLPIIIRWIAPGTTIWSEQWAAYNNLANISFQHRTVNHTLHFVDPNTLLTMNRVEAMWQHAKSKLKAMMGPTNRDMIQDHLAEFMWSQRFNDSPFYNFWHQIKNVLYYFIAYSLFYLKRLISTLFLRSVIYSDDVIMFLLHETVVRKDVESWSIFFWGGWGCESVVAPGIVRSVIKRGTFLQSPISKRRPSREELLQYVIPIRYTSNNIVKSEVSVTLKPIASLPFVSKDNMALKWDIVRATSSLYREVAEWSGFMRQITKETKVDGKHQVEFLPFVDMDPNNLSTVYTTLMFVIDECKNNGIEPVVTFDQPLWLKSMMIKKKENLSITILLGNFHTQMSYLGSIDYVMKNSGILELFSTIYAENSAKKMLEGKQYERAMRAHNLLLTVLKKVILQQISVNNESLFQNVAIKYDECLKNGVDEESIPINTDRDYLAIESEFSKLCEALSASHLNKLWILYMEMVDLLHVNLMAERSGNWDMYLFSLKCMLPYFAGTWAQQLYQISLLVSARNVSFESKSTGRIQKRIVCCTEDGHLLVGRFSRSMY